MKRIGIVLVALLSVTPYCISQMPGRPEQISVRYTAQVSNAPAGTCGCFTLQGGEVDANWKLIGLFGKRATLDLAADLGADHTGAVNNAGYGLTLSTFTFGPRFTLPATKKIAVFGQTLFGLAHGSGSQFPSGNSLTSGANSFALNLSAGGDYRINPLLSIRVLQLDYLRTQLPNTTSNWQNNLRIGAGVTLHLH